MTMKRHIFRRLSISVGMVSHGFSTIQGWVIFSWRGWSSTHFHRGETIPRSHRKSKNGESHVQVDYTRKNWRNIPRSIRENTEKCGNPIEISVGWPRAPFIPFTDLWYQQRILTNPPGPGHETCPRFPDASWILGRNSQNLLFFAPSFGLLNSQHASKVPDLLQESMTYSWYLLPFGHFWQIQPVM